MQIVIEIPDIVKTRCDGGGILQTIDIIKLKNAVAHGTPLPDGATNGDIIKAVFDVTEVRQLDCCAFIDTSDDANLRVYKDWWNAPYKRGDGE